MDKFLKQIVAQASMGKDAGGPSVMSMYNQENATGQNPNLGRGTGNVLLNREMQAQTEFAAPTEFQEIGDVQRVALQQKGMPMSYNTYEPYPVKYTAPSDQAERIKNRQVLRDITGQKTEGTKTRIVDSISEDEVNYLNTMKSQAELADFDRYVNSYVDVRQPGNLKWLMEIYPEFVGRRIQQVHSDMDFAIRNQMIDSWGVNTFDDLHFKFLVDQKKIDGPRLGKRIALDDKYTPGVLSPYAFKIGGDNRNGLRMPFSSATVGPRPVGTGTDGEPNEWMFPDNGPMSRNRTTKELAEGMYASKSGDGQNAGASARSQLYERARYRAM